MKKEIKLLEIEANELTIEKYDKDPTKRTYKLKAITFSMFDEFEKKYDHAEKSGEGEAQLNKMKSLFYSANSNEITIYQGIPYYSFLSTKEMYGPIQFVISVDCD